MRVRTPRGLTRISREACCRVIGIKMANGASIKGLTDFRLLSRAHAVGPSRRVALFRRFFVATRAFTQAKTRARSGTERYEISLLGREIFSTPYPRRQRYSRDGSSFGCLNSREWFCSRVARYRVDETVTIRRPRVIWVEGGLDKKREEQTNKGTNEREDRRLLEADWS